MPPIESVVIEKVAAKPPNSTLVVVSGGLNSCESFNEYNLTQEGDTFQVEVTNLKQASPDNECTADFGTITHRIPLSSDTIEACETYAVEVNGESYSVRASCPAIEGGQLPEPTATLDQTPEWLADLIQSLEFAHVANPPSSIVQYEYEGQTAYFVPQALLCSLIARWLR